MCPFSKKKPEAPPAAPASHATPMDMLFANYVRHVLGELPADLEAKLAALAPKFQQALKTTSSDWKSIVAEALHLSPTIDIAILDLWYANQDLARERNVTLTAQDYARMFVEQFLAPGSRVDVWTPEALAQARARVAERQQAR